MMAVSTARTWSSSDAGSDGKPASLRSLHDSARGSPDPQPAIDGFQSLVDQINAILGPSNGIDSDDVNVEELERAMAAYESKESEWSKYAFSNESMNYTRNLVDSGNGKANLVSQEGKKCSPARPKIDSPFVVLPYWADLNGVLYTTCHWSYLAAR